MIPELILQFHTLTTHGLITIHNRFVQTLTNYKQRAHCLHPIMDSKAMPPHTFPSNYPHTQKNTQICSGNL